MARIAFLVKQPKRALGALAVIVAATGVVIGSGASFTATSANANNDFSAGTLSIHNGNGTSAILTATGMKPGDVKTGTVDIRNSGTLAGDFTLRRGALTNTPAANPLADKLNVLVVDCGEWPNSSTPEPCDDGDDVQRVNSTLSAMTGTSALGNFSAEEKHTYKFTVTFDATASDVYQGAQSVATFTWDATQS